MFLWGELCCREAAVEMGANFSRFVAYRARARTQLLISLGEIHAQSDMNNTPHYLHYSPTELRV